jgi:hypothetical protein
MATFNKFNKFVLNKGNGVFNLSTNQLKVALTNTAPAATLNQYSELTSPLPTTNFSGATPFNITTTSFTQTSGTSKLILADLTLTASGSIDPFRYVVIYSDTATNKELIGYYDYGTTVNMVAVDTFVIDFSAANGVITEA